MDNNNTQTYIHVPDGYESIPDCAKRNNTNYMTVYRQIHARVIPSMIHAGRAFVPVDAVLKLACKGCKQYRHLREFQLKGGQKRPRCNQCSKRFNGIGRLARSYEITPSRVRQILKTRRDDLSLYAAYGGNIGT